MPKPPAGSVSSYVLLFSFRPIIDSVRFSLLLELQPRKEYLICHLMVGLAGRAAPEVSGRASNPEPAFRPDCETSPWASVLGMIQSCKHLVHPLLPSLPLSPGGLSVGHQWIILSLSSLWDQPMRTPQRTPEGYGARPGVGFPAHFLCDGPGPVVSLQ